MATKVCVIALILALVIVADSTSYDDATWGMTRLSSGDGDLPAMRSCNGRVGECIGDEEEMMDSEGSHRQLTAVRRRYISYETLKKDRVPCRRPGQSYYDCRKSRRANPYRRACNYITHCARDLS